MEKENKLIPNSTQIPNVILDLIIPGISEAETKCLLYICRRTYGFHKEKDRISLSQFVDGLKDKDGKKLDYGAGLSRPAVVEALKNLIGAGIIKAIKTPGGNYYEINLDFIINNPIEGGVVNKVNQLRKLTRSSKVSKPEVVNLVNPQNKEKQRETKYNAAGKPSAHKEFIKFFYDNCQRFRSIKPIITKADAKNLKRILDLKILNQSELEQLAVYFLANRYYKKFSPSISTLFSSGIINGLMNNAKNNEIFWKELDSYMTQINDKTDIEPKKIITGLTQLKIILNNLQRAKDNKETATSIKSGGLLFKQTKMELKT